VAAAVVALDQITKHMVRAGMDLHERIDLLTGSVALVHGRNPGMGFGILSDSPVPYQRVVLSSVALFASLAIVYLLRGFPARPRAPRLAMGLILGGAAGNLLDRVRLGYVTDFVHLAWRGYSWPDFNAADSAITVGAAVLVLYSLLGRREG
jgi:signal peptidase II